VHRDLKPDNVMLLKGSRGLAKIMDFGLAQLAGASKLTQAGTTLGTMSYMSPEQAEGGEVDRRSDIWSLGVMLYEMVAGQPPFRGDFDQAVVYSILNEAPEPLTAVRTGVPKELERIVGKCLAKSADQRYQNVEDLLVDLSSLSDQLRTEGSRVAPVAQASAARPRRPDSGLRKYATGAVAVLALAALVWALRKPLPQPESAIEPLHAVNLTSYPGSESDPSFSPDGEQIAFSWDGPEGNNQDIYVKGLGTDEPRRLTSDPRPDLGSAWSPDGRSIVWLRAVPLDGETSYEIVQAPVVGGSERVWGAVARYTNRLPRPVLTWTPDSQALVVRDRNPESGRMALFVLSTDGSKRRLTSPPEPFDDSAPAFSPDGRTLAFVRARGLYRHDVYTLELTEEWKPLGEPRRLTHDDDLAAGLSWAPDGRSLVYSAGLPARTELWRLPLTSQAPSRRRLGLRAQAWNSTAVARAGGRLVFVQGRVDVNIHMLTLRPGDTERLRPQRIVASSRLDYNPQFSPDGARMAFSSNRSGEETSIYIADADGSNVELLYGSPTAHSGTPRWSPDGQRVAFDSNLDGNSNIFVISANGGNPLQLTSNPANDVIPSWSHDGEWVYFSSNRSGRPEVWKKRLGGDESVQVTTGGGGVAFESPDGKYLYYLRANLGGPLYRMPAQGGDEELVVESVGSRQVAVNEDGVYFISEAKAVSAAENDTQRYRIGRYDPQTGAVETVVLLPEGGRPYVGFSVSQATGAAAYAQVDREESDLMLVEDFE